MAAVASVVFYSGNDKLGGGGLIDGSSVTYTFDWTPTAEGIYNIFAVAVDDDGFNGLSGQTTTSIEPFVFKLGFTDPISNPFTLESTSYEDGIHTFEVEVQGIDSQELQSVTWLLDGVEVATAESSNDSLLFSQELRLSKSGVVTALATSTYGLVVQASIAVELSLAEPPSDEELFVIDVYQRLSGVAPTAEQVAAALLVVNETIDSRVSFLQQLFDSAEMDENEMIMMVHRTMTGEWPDATELVGLRGGTAEGSSSSSESGSIAAGATQSFDFYLNAGARVTLLVSGDSLSDPTLTLNGPNGEQVAFDDDSGNGLNPLLVYTTTQAGTYTATVASWSSFSGGDFTFDIISTDSSDSDELSAQSLVRVLIPEFEERKGITFPTTLDVAGSEAVELVGLLFANKHQVAINRANTTRLRDTLVGADLPDYGTVLPGYSGDLTAFTAAFALDNELTRYFQTSLSRVHYYSLPNQPVDRVGLALLVSTFLGVDPTATALGEYSGMTQREAFAAILGDSRYSYTKENSDDSDDSDDSVASFVAFAMAEAGVYQVGLSGPEGDADGDGQSNLEEIALGSDPADGSDQVSPLETLVDGSDFVVTFIRIKASEVPSDLIIYAQCSEDLVNWDDREDTADVAAVSVDQSGVSDGYQRVELRFDMATRDCRYVRLVVDVP